LESSVDKPIITDNSSKDGLCLTSLLNVPIKDAMVEMLAEVLAKALQCQQTSPSRPCSRHKIPEPSMEYFTNNQYQENKVRDSPFETALLIKPQANV
jgi:hypothetical protein